MNEFGICVCICHFFFVSLRSIFFVCVRTHAYVPKKSDSRIMEIQEQLANIEELQNTYELMLETGDANSHEAIQTFLAWHTAAVEFFAEVLGVDEPLLEKFQPDGLDGNGYGLRSVYQSILGTYVMLKVKVKKYGEQNGQSNTVGQPMDNTKPKKIFISHSSTDKKFTHALIMLLNTLGFGENDIFCSSEPGYWIKKGNFFQVIKEQFEKNDLYVIFIQSPRFYASSVSLNEMGAAWALHSEYYSFLTKDMEYAWMNAVVNNQEIACKIDSLDAKDRLNDWQKDILKYFGKPEISNMSIWEKNRDEFLRRVRSLRYKPMKQQDGQPEQQKEVARLTENDEKILKAWVDTEDINMYYMFSMDGRSVVLGEMEYVYDSGHSEAKWNAFFKRLLAIGLVEYVGTDDDGPRYRLTEAAFNYFGK